MENWQKTYIENTRSISRLSNFFASEGSAPETWAADRQKAREQCVLLRKENISLLNRYLFPALDELHSLDSTSVDALVAFADELLDWKTNLDPGVYVVIHDALLSVARVRKDTDAVIRELYKLGMGYYYLRRYLNGIDVPEAAAFEFQNEMVFTEAGSYLHYFDQLENEDTKGYIIRAMANVALCTRNTSRRIAASAKTLQVAQDPHYRQQAPNLPWDAFVRKTHQQMSANREELSSGTMTTAELAAVLDSCYEIFKPEEQSENPSVRWIWPFYEMEYNCGYVSAEVTLSRIEHLVSKTPPDQFDMSGLYANVQLPVYYGRLLKEHPRLLENTDSIRFLNEAYRKMIRVLLTCPPDAMDDYFFYVIRAVITDYYEVEGVPSYKEITRQLLARFGGEDYIRFCRTGAVIRCICAAIYQKEPDFFDDIPFLAAIGDPAEKEKALMAYAQDCGLYFDFGLLKMNISRTMLTRNLFENEYRMYCLHTDSGHNDLIERPSTACFADIALGHHRWYDGSDGYPVRYVRNRSPYRQMTDITACAAYLAADPGEDPAGTLSRMQKKSGKQFSPMVMAYLSDQQLADEIQRILKADPSPYYEEIRQYVSG